MGARKNDVRVHVAPPKTFLAMPTDRLRELRERYRAALLTGEVGVDYALQVLAEVEVTLFVRGAVL